ncbi:hypothetical protein MMC29_000568 [Sticta canariensis]|nr:hypothetical protein [Sticta canariensis]
MPVRRHCCLHLMQLEEASSQHESTVTDLQQQLQAAHAQHAAQQQEAQAAMQNLTAAADEAAQQQLEQGLQALRWELQTSKVSNQSKRLRWATAQPDMQQPSDLRIADAQAALEASHQARAALQSSFASASAHASDAHKQQCQIAADATLLVETLQGSLTAAQEQLSAAEEQLNGLKADGSRLQRELDKAQADVQASTPFAVHARLEEQHAEHAGQLQEAAAAREAAGKEHAAELAKLQEEQQWLRGKLAETERSRNTALLVILRLI